MSIIRIIRWKGLVLFFAISAVTAAFILLFAEPLLKNQLIKQAEKLNKAEVNIERVHIHYAPLGVSLHHVEITNAEIPTENLIQFKSLSARVDLWQYWYGKTIIDELAVEGVVLDHKRRTIGKLLPEPDINTPSANEEGINQETNKDRQKISKGKPEGKPALPSVSAVLNDSQLLTVINSKILEISYKEEEGKLNQTRANLPSKDALEDYKKQIKRLSNRKIKSSSDLKRLKSDFSALKAKFKKDKKALAILKKQLAASKKRLLPQIKQLKASPAKDWQQIEQKYRAENGGSAAIAELLFGDKAGEYTRYAAKVFSYIKPYIDSENEAGEEISESGKLTSQRFIHFKEQHALPSFLLRKGVVSLSLPEGDFLLHIDNLTHQHWIQNKTTKIHISSRNAGEGNFDTQAPEIPLGKVDIHNDFAFTESAKFSGKGNWQVDAYPLRNVKLMSKDNFEIKMTSALFSGDGQLTNTVAILNSKNSIALTETTYAGTTHSSLQRSILSVLNDTKELMAKIQVKGTYDSPSILIDSSIDTLFMEALRKETKVKMTRFKSKVQSGLQAKLAAALDINHKQFEQMAELEQRLSQSDKTLDNLLKSDVIEDKVDALKDKMKNKLSGKLKKIF